ncbi:MAG: choice-of-anchor D domain-containing protein [Paracoccaceae bacterium]
MAVAILVLALLAARPVCAQTTPEINVTGNGQTIADGDTSASTADHTNFGRTYLNGGSLTRTFTIQNSGDTVLNISNVAVSGASAGDFSITGAPSTVAAGGAATFDVTFAPLSGSGLRAVTLTITNDDADEGTYDFALVAQAENNYPPVLTVGTNQIVASGATVTLAGSGFSDGNSGNDEPLQPLTLTWQQTSGPAVTLSSTTVTQTGSAALNPTFTAPVLAAGDAAVTLMFRLTGTDGLATVTRTTSVQVAPPAPEINVTGNGVTIADGDTTPASADFTDFGNASLGYSVQRAYLITNTGDADLAISSISLSGDGAGAYTIFNAPSTVPAGQSRYFGVAFQPTAPVTSSATVTIANSDSDEGSFAFAITGTGTNVAPSAAAGTDQTFDSGAAALVVGWVYADQNSGRDDFAQIVTGTWSQISGPDVSLSGEVTLSRAGSRMLGVRFTAPTLARGAPDAVIVLRLTADDGLSTATDDVTITIEAPPLLPEINVTGNGVTIADGDGSPDAADHTNFGSTYRFGGTITRTFTIQNTGEAVLTISGITVTSSPGLYTVTGAPTSVAVGGSKTFNITYAPTSQSSGTLGQVRIQNNDADESLYDFIITGTSTNIDAGADAGADRAVASGAAVTLAGTVYSDQNNGADEPLQALTGTWSQVSGTAVTLSNATASGNGSLAVNAGFTAPTLTPGGADETLVFRLRAFDDGRNFTDEVTITVEAPRQPEITVRGNGHTILSGSVVARAGDNTHFRDTYPNGGSITRSFTIQNSGNVPLTISGISLSGGDAALFSVSGAPSTVAAGASETFDITFVAAGANGYRNTTVIIANNDTDESSFSFLIQADVYNRTPRATVGASQSVASGAEVTLSGSGVSDGFDGFVEPLQPVTLTWQQISGPAVTLSQSTVTANGTATLNPSFTAPTLVTTDAPVSLEFELTAFDGLATNARRTAVQVYPPEPDISISGNGVTIASGDTSPGAGDHTDFGSIHTNGGTVARVFTIHNTGPGDLTISRATLQGPFGGDFVVTGLPGAVTAGQTAGFTVTFAPTGTITTRTTDLQIVSTDPDTPTYWFRITGTATNIAPTANAGADQTVASGAEVTLPGHVFSDSNSGADEPLQRVTGTWVQVSGPTVTLGGTTTATANGAATVNASFTAPSIAYQDGDTDLVFGLTANDGSGAITDSVTITVEALGPPDIRVTGDGGNIVLNGNQSPNSLNGTLFPRTELFRTSYRTFTIHNDGPSTLEISGISRSGGSFNLDGAVPTSVPPNGQANFRVVASPYLIGNWLGGITITSNDPNESPYFFHLGVQGVYESAAVDAGPDQSVDYADTVTLDATITPPAQPGRTITYSWAQISGESVTLTGTDTLTPSFVAPTLIGGTTHDVVFELTVNDEVFTQSDTVTVTISKAPGPEIGVTGNGVAIADGDTTPDGGDHTLLGTVWPLESASRSFLIQNNGTAPLVISSIAVSGEESGDFALQGATPGSIAPGGQQTITVVATAQGYGHRTATLTINSNDAQTPAFDFVIEVTGRLQANVGSDITVFSGEVVTLQGTGAPTLAPDHPINATPNISWVKYLPGVTYPDLSQGRTTTPSFTAPTRAVGAPPIQYAFRMDMRHEGVYSTDNLIVTVMPPPEPSIAVSGGRDIPNGDMSPRTLDSTRFVSTYPRGGGSTERTFTIRNSGPVPLTISSLTVVPQNAGEFTVVSAPTTVAAFGEEPLTIRFTPQFAARGTAIVTIYSDATDDPVFTFMIDGIGTDANPDAQAGPDQIVLPGSAVTVSGQGFADLAAGVDEPLQQVTATWTQVSGPSVTLGGTTTVTANGAAPADISFTARPLPSGAREAVIVLRLTVTDGATTVTDDITIYVRDPEPTIRVIGGRYIANGKTGTAYYDFTRFIATYALGGTTERTFRILNEGSAPLTISSITVAPQNADEFTVVSAPTSVAAGQEETFTIRFAPQLADWGSAIVTINSNAPDDLAYTFTIDGLGRNTAPAANAGADQTVPSGSSVTVSGQGYSDVNSGAGEPLQPVTATWTQVSGPSVTLGGTTTTTANGAATADVSFTAPSLARGAADAVVVLRLTSDDGLTTVTDDIAITVQAGEPEINVTGNGVDITDGDTTPASADHTDFGSTYTNGGTVARTFTIQNTGDAALTVSGFTLTGGAGSPFSISGARRPWPLVGPRVSP